MGPVQLSKREQLIRRILRLSDAQVAVLERMVQELETASVLAPTEVNDRSTQPSESSDDSLAALRLSAEEIESVARAEGWTDRTGEDE